MRRIVSAISAAALAFGMVSTAAPANALTAGFDSAWITQSDYLARAAGAPNELIQAFFANTGTTSWVKGTATQVDLSVCLEDKVTCNVSDAGDADFNAGWLSASRYAAQDQTTVAPGGIAAFKYNIQFLSGKAAGIYRLNGDLVVSVTGDRIHPEGYFHQQEITGPPVGVCTPTTITTTPTSANNQVGTTHTQSVTVTCADNVAASGTQVTFVVDAPVGSLNADLTLTATTNASGVATVTWTRSNPDIDSVSVFPTSTPAVRATATKTWSAGAFVITCTPTESATQLNGSSRTFTVTVRNPSTGALASGVAVDLTTTTSITATAASPRGAAATTTIGGTAFPFTAGTTVATVTTGTSGTSLGVASFSVVGTPSAANDILTFTVRAFVEGQGFSTGGTANELDANEHRADCGTTSFERLRAAAVTVTPDTAATNAALGNKVYTVTAVDQFGAAFANANLRMRFSFNEFISGAGTTARINVNFNPTGAVPGTQGAGTAPTARTDCPGTAGFANQNVALPTSSNGTWYVMVCASAATTATPIAWYDTDGNANPGTTAAEAQDTGGTKTWAAAAPTSASLAPSSRTNAASSGTPTAGTNTVRGTIGEERYTARLVDQSGNALTLTDTATVRFTVANTGSGTVFIVRCRNRDTTVAGTISGGEITAGGSGTCDVTLATTTTERAEVWIDKVASGTASINCTLTMGSQVFQCNAATKTWVSAGTLIQNATASTTEATGTVVAFDTGTSTDDRSATNLGAGAYYTIKTTAGNFTIFHDGTHRYLVDGTTSTETIFEDNISLGDKVQFIGGGVPSPSTLGEHKLTNQ